MYSIELQINLLIAKSETAKRFYAKRILADNRVLTVRINNYNNIGD